MSLLSEKDFKNVLEAHTLRELRKLVARMNVPNYIKEKGKDVKIAKPMLVKLMLKHFTGSTQDGKPVINRSLFVDKSGTPSVSTTKKLDKQAIRDQVEAEGEEMGLTKAEIEKEIRKRLRLAKEQVKGETAGQAKAKKNVETNKKVNMLTEEIDTINSAFEELAKNLGKDDEELVEIMSEYAPIEDLDGLNELLGTIDDDVIEASKLLAKLPKGSKSQIQGITYLSKQLRTLRDVLKKKNFQKRFAMPSDAVEMVLDNIKKSLGMLSALSKSITKKK